MIYLVVALRVLVAIGTIAVGATLARKAKPLGGYLMIAAGALMALARCCTVGLALNMPSFLTHVAGMMDTLLVFGLLIAAAVVLAQAAAAPSAPEEG